MAWHGMALRYADKVVPFVAEGERQQLLDELAAAHAV
jgi:hypothetical protein